MGWPRSCSSDVYGKVNPGLIYIYTTGKGGIMGKAIVLWWLGVPGVIVLLLYFLVF